MAENGVARSSVAWAAAQVVAAALVGLLALPTVLGQGAFSAGGVIPDSPAQRIGGLVVAVAVAVWLLAVAPTLVRALADLLASLQVRSTAAAAVANLSPAAIAGAFARGLVAAGYVLLVQAILRQPLVAVLGVYLDPVSVEEVFAALALALLLVVLYRIHLAARPLVEAAVWSALDALVATSGSESAGYPTVAEVEAATVAAQDGDATRPAGDADATRPAGRASTNG